MSENNEEKILRLQKQLEEIRKQKFEAIANQKFDEAAEFRSSETEILLCLDEFESPDKELTLVGSRLMERILNLEKRIEKLEQKDN